MAAASAAFRIASKPLKRLYGPNASNTGLKPGANEMMLVVKSAS